MKSNNKPLRRSTDLKFLKLAPLPTDDDYFDCIYEAQISVLVTGSNQWSWTAFAFVDTYYKNPPTSGDTSEQADTSGDAIPWNLNQERADCYHHQYKATHGLIDLDPLTGGQHQLDPTIWRPREYFLKVLRSRVQQVNREWHNTVYRILQKIEPHVSLAPKLP